MTRGWRNSPIAAAVLLCYTVAGQRREELARLLRGRFWAHCSAAGHYCLAAGCYGRFFKPLLPASPSLLTPFSAQSSLKTTWQQKNGRKKAYVTADYARYPPVCAGNRPHAPLVFDRIVSHRNGRAKGLSHRHRVRAFPSYKRLLFQVHPPTLSLSLSFSSPLSLFLSYSLFSFLSKRVITTLLTILQHFPCSVQKTVWYLFGCRMEINKRNNKHLPDYNPSSITKGLFPFKNYY